MNPFSSSSFSSHQPVQLRVDPPQTFDAEGNPHALLTERGQKVVRQIFRSAQLIPICEYYFAHQKKTPYEFTNEPFGYRLSSDKKIIFCHLNNVIYAIKNELIGEGASKILHKGVQLNNCTSVAFSISHERDCIQDIAILKILSSSNTPKSANICYHLATTTFRRKIFIFSPYSNRLDLHSYRHRLAQKPHRLHLHVARKIMLGIDYLHEHGLIHLDIKPGNILVNVTTNSIGKVVTSIKITDFGDAVFEDRTWSKLNIHGTHGYTSPEVKRMNRLHRESLRHKNCNFALLTKLKGAAEQISFDSDIWSLARTLDRLFSHAHNGAYVDYWHFRWGRYSPLTAVDRVARPTIRECISYINSDMRSLKFLK